MLDKKSRIYAGSLEILPLNRADMLFAISYYGDSHNVKIKTLPLLYFNPINQRITDAFNSFDAEKLRHEYLLSNLRSILHAIDCYLFTINDLRDDRLNVVFEEQIKSHLRQKELCDFFIEVINKNITENYYLRQNAELLFSGQRPVFSDRDDYNAYTYIGGPEFRQSKFELYMKAKYKLQNDSIAKLTKENEMLRKQLMKPDTMFPHVPNPFL